MHLSCFIYKRKNKNILFLNIIRNEIRLCIVAYSGNTPKNEFTCIEIVHHYSNKLVIIFVPLQTEYLSILLFFKNTVLVVKKKTPVL